MAILSHYEVVIIQFNWMCSYLYVKFYIV